MTFTFEDLVYYGSLTALLAVYGLSFRPYRLGEVSSFYHFRNAAIVYFSLFSVLFGKLVYDGTLLASADHSPRLYGLMLYYGVVLIGTAAVFNLAPEGDIRIERTRLNQLPFLFALSIKAAFLLVDLTPMQALLFEGFAAAHVRQSEWHQPGHSNIVKSFYVFFGPALSVLFIVYFKQSRSLLFRALLVLLTFETSAFYFSKWGMIIPLIVFLIISGVKLRYVSLLVLAGIVGAFYLRLGGSNVIPQQLLTTISERLVWETAYANPQLALYEAESPPLGYESRYYLGMNTLFGIQPALDASREAYTNETGRYGATSSGHAAVSLYAFWGPAFFLVTPALIAFVFFTERLVRRRLRSEYDLVAYLFITFKSVNYLTVDLQRFISFHTLIDLTFLSSVLLIYVVGRILRLRMFSLPISLYGSGPAVLARSGVMRS